MFKKLVLIVMFIVPVKLWAQSSVSGTVYDFDDKLLPLPEVNVKNVTKQQTTKTKASGQFSIAASKGDLIVFALNGYHIDTLYLIDLSPKTVYLPDNSTVLNEVKIVNAKINPTILTPDPEAEASTRIETDGLRGKKNNDRAGGLILNLGNGKYKREQDKVKELEEKDHYEEEINKVFTEEYVSHLVKLKGQELKDFMALYRPTVLLVKSERPFNYDFYTVTAYHAWLKRPPAQRKAPPVPKLKGNK